MDLDFYFWETILPLLILPVLTFCLGYGVGRLQNLWSTWPKD